MTGRPSLRYERLSKLNDSELRHALQLLHIDYASFALPSVYEPPPLQRDDFAAFTSLSPDPFASAEGQDNTEAENFVSDYPSLSPAVLDSLINAALATREPYIDAADQNKPRPSAPTAPTATATATANPASVFAPTTIPRPALHQNTSPVVSSPAARPNGNQLLKTSSFHTARSRLLNSSLKRPSASSSETHGRKQGLSAPAPARAVLGTKRPRPHPQQHQQNGDLDPDLPEVPNVEPKLVQMIMNEALEKSPGVEWDDIAGLHFAKQCVMEAVVWPMLRPDIFSGLRGPPKGLLLFGPPGTGKTMIGRAIASKSGAKFFNISASSMVSKWAGEGEKTVRALFGVARLLQPSVVFIDEIDSLLTQRTDGEQEHSRRIKTEFLVQMDGAGTSREDRVLVVGATNRPQELDEAARRRLVKRLYIPLPDAEARESLVKTLMHKQTHALSEPDVSDIATLSDGYSGSDMYALCAEAALGPVRDLGDALRSIDASSVRAVNMSDFRKACRMVRASVSQNDLDGYVKWNESFGSFSMKEQEETDAGTTATATK